jgi:hypothetical protein
MVGGGEYESVGGVESERDEGDEDWRRRRSEGFAAHQPLVSSCAFVDDTSSTLAIPFIRRSEAASAPSPFAISFPRVDSMKPLPPGLKHSSEDRTTEDVVRGQ